MSVAIENITGTIDDLPTRHTGSRVWVFDDATERWQFWAFNPVSEVWENAFESSYILTSNSVTNAKLAQMTAKTYKGRTTNSTGSPEDVPVATLKADLSLVKGDVGLGSVDNTADTAKPVSTAQQTALDLKANLASPTFTGTVSGVTKSMVGLGNVDNTSDANKPVSTAQQTALDLKANLASPTFTGTVSGITKSMVGLGSVVNADTTTTANITDATNKRFVTDANLTTIGNQSGTNTGDNATNTQYSGLAVSKQDALVSGTNIKTINSSSILGSGDLVVSAGDTALAPSANKTVSSNYAFYAPSFYEIVSGFYLEIASGGVVEIG